MLTRDADRAMLTRDAPYLRKKSKNPKNEKNTRSSSRNSQLRKHRCGNAKGPFGSDDELGARAPLGAPLRALVVAAEVVLLGVRRVRDKHAGVRPGARAAEAQLLRHCVAGGCALVEGAEERLSVRLRAVLHDAAEVRAVALVRQLLGTRGKALPAGRVRALGEGGKLVLLRVRRRLRDLAVPGVRALPAQVLAEDRAARLAVHERGVVARQFIDIVLRENAAVGCAEAVVAPVLSGNNGQDGGNGAHGFCSCFSQCANA